MASKAAPRNAMARAYMSSDFAMKFVDEPDALVRSFTESVREAEAHFGAQTGSASFFDTTSREPAPAPGMGNTREVSAMLAERGPQKWDVLGDPSLDFFYVDREVRVTHSAELDRPAAEIETADLSADLLLASADGSGTPIIGELKVTTSKGPDKNPFYALIQALACATYLLPESQQRRLPDGSGRLRPGSRLDVYVLLAGGPTGGGEPAASDVWFDRREQAERLSAATIDGLSEWIRTIAFIELAWLPKPSGPMRPLRVTKRFAVSSGV